jgi:trehalose-phosphatase
MDNILSTWSRIKKQLEKRFVYLLLDYDGTLTPIASTPEKAVLSGKIRDVLEELSGSPDCKIAVISGRSLANLKKLIGLPNIVYVGNHGYEIKGPKIDFKSPVSRRYVKALEKIKKKMGEKLRGIEGSFIEDKGFTLSVHYRLVDKKDIPLVRAIIYETTIVHEVMNDISLRPGKMVLEVRPPLGWGKGEAALWLLARQKFLLRDKRKDIMPICIGDDETDEDMFRALKSKGITISVGRRKRSRAEYYLRDTGEVYRLLKQISGILNPHKRGR